MDKDYIYTQKTLPETGSFAKLCLNYSSAKRSNHPSNSFIAIGPKSDEILCEHNQDAMLYDPMKKLVELKAKMVIFGVIDESPGFTTVHLAQQELGLTKKSLLKNLFRVYYKDENNNTKLFKKSDIGGCSAGFNKFYAHYLANNLLKIGSIGKSSALLIESEKAYDLEYKLINNDNSFHFCDNPLCMSCRLTWKYDLKYSINYILLKSISLFMRKKK